MKYRVIYFTEFGSKETTLNESKLVEFIYRFKVSSIKALITQRLYTFNIQCMIYRTLIAKTAFNV